MTTSRHIAAALLGSMVLSSALVGAAEPEPDLFERRIRPLLAKHCYECHGPEEQESELRLDQAEGIFKGGASGKSIVPGDPEGSLLITAVRYRNTDLQMPPNGKLADTEIADLQRWVEAGAPHPDGRPDAKQPAPESNDNWQARRDHWSFQPIARPELPSVREINWIETSVDRFILAELEHGKLAPAPPADRRTLLRRATYDLTGLPPTPEELEAFVADESPRAYAKVIDRLLASPRYGERWGRHWLDVARYADSNGLDENVAHGNAWRYRNWVIDAFNNDLPYDDFIRQQVAGDLLAADEPLQRNGYLIATGFLSLGPKVLAEVDKQKMEMDIIDEQIDTLGRAFLGLTLGCARCHDHKFDPITAADYYALAGIFKSSHTMDSLKTIAQWHEHELFGEEHQLAKSVHKERLAAKQLSLDELLTKSTAELQQQLGEAAALPAKPEESFPEPTRAALQQLREELAAIEKQAPVAPSAMGVREGEPTEVAIHIRGSHLTLGKIIPRGIPQVFASESSPVVEAAGSGRMALANWIVQPGNPLTARVMVNRVWRWHFGRGLVETPDNFGRRGTEPTNAALLDHLATEFMRDWSVKRLHRTIMLSATYQTSSETTAEAARIDPDNHLYGRTRIRRLEAEEIRDSILFLSDSLDRSMPGTTIVTENRKHVFDHTSKDETTYANNRRSVYLPVIRNHLHESLTLFDYTDASVSTGHRNSSTVASQALYLLNSEFVIGSAQRLAARIQNCPADSDAGRLDWIYELTLGRQPTPEEATHALAFLDRLEMQTNRQQAWQLLCHNLLISNEFFYLR